LRFDLAEDVASVFVAVRRRSKAVEERGACPEMDRRSPGRLHLTDGDELIAERLKRSHHLLELEVAPLLLRVPVFGPHATRKVDGAEAERRAGRSRKRRDHGIHERQCNRGSQGALHERTARKMLFRDEHFVYLLLVILFVPILHYLPVPWKVPPVPA